LDIFFRGNLPGLAGEETKGRACYLSFIQHWEGGTTKWGSKCPVETAKDFSGMSFSFLFLFLFYIENNNKGKPAGEKNNTNFSKTIFHRKSSHLLGQKRAKQVKLASFH